MIISSADEINIVKDLLIVLGLEIQPEDNSIVDQDTKSQIKYEGKSIRANNDINNILVIGEGDIKFEPTNPRCSGLMEKMFGRFLDNEQEEGNIPEVLVYFFDRDVTDEEIPIYRLNVKTTSYKWTGPWYYNKVLCYTDAIFSLDGTFAFNNDRLRWFDDPNTRNDEE